MASTLFTLKNSVRSIHKSVSHRNLIQIAQRKVGWQDKDYKEYETKPIEPTVYRSNNFSAGPGSIDLNVLQYAQKELLNYENTGMSLIEMPCYKEGELQNLISTVSHRIRNLLNVPNSHHIFFMHGGAHNHQYNSEISLVSL